VLEKIRERVSTSLVIYSIIMQERYILRVDKPSLKLKERVFNFLFLDLTRGKLRILKRKNIIWFYIAEIDPKRDQNSLITDKPCNQIINHDISVTFYLLFILFLYSNLYSPLCLFLRQSWYLTS
jgi:hypothetical protein